MMIKKWSLVFFCFCLLQVASAQEKDFGIWYGVSAEHRITKKLEIDLSTDVRTFNNASKIEEAFIEGGLAYNFTKHLVMEGSYRLTDNLENNNLYYYQHKLLFDFKGNIPVRKLRFSGSFRFQIRYKTYIKDENDNYPDYESRIRLKSVYKTQTFPVNPYAYVDAFYPVFSDKPGTIGKLRISAGLELKITNIQSVQTEYIFQRDYYPHLSDINIISINYVIKF